MGPISDSPLPPYAFVPGGRWPHPRGSPQGHSFALVDPPVTPIGEESWRASEVYLRGFALFNAGYYWEAHEAWELLWHAHGRKGETAELLKALIKLAAAGVKVRERQPRGVVVHATRASALLAELRKMRSTFLGLNLADLEAAARRLAEYPPVDSTPDDARVAHVVGFRIELEGMVRPSQPETR